MANICNTDLKLYREDNPFKEQEAREIEKWLNENVAYDNVYNIEGFEDELLEIQMGTKWNIPTEQLKTLAQMFNCEIRAIGREDGCCFIGYVKINDQGELLTEEYLNTD